MKIKLSELIPYSMRSCDDAQLDKIAQFYYVPLNKVRDELGLPIHIRSCFRSVMHEIKMKRDGKSHHTFPRKSLGACDVSLTSHSVMKYDKKDMERLLDLLIEAGFKRITWYPTLHFFHIDYESKELKFYISDENNKWILQNDKIRI